MFFCLGEGKRSKKDKHEKTNVPVDHGNGFSQSGTSYRSWWGLATGFSKTHFRLSFREAEDAPTWTVGFGGGAISAACVKVCYQFRHRCVPVRRMKSAPPVVWMAARSGLPVHFLAFWAGDFPKSLGT